MKLYLSIYIYVYIDYIDGMLAKLAAQNAAGSTQVAARNTSQKSTCESGSRNQRGDEVHKGKASQDISVFLKLATHHPITFNK